jgi:hypothetical protein
MAGPRRPVYLRREGLTPRVEDTDCPLVMEEMPSIRGPPSPHANVANIYLRMDLSQRDCCSYFVLIMPATSERDCKHPGSLAFV